MSKIKLFLAALTFGVILILIFLGIKPTSAAAPYPSGNASAVLCAYNYNTLRYTVSSTSWSHRADTGYDWVNCGRASNSYGSIWMPDSATDLYIFQVTSSSANDVLVLRDVNSNQIVYRSSLSSMAGPQISLGGTIIKTPGTLRLNLSNLGQRVIRVEGPQGLRVHFNIRKRATAPPPPPQPGAFSLSSASINCSGTQPYGYISWSNSLNATRYEVYRRNANSSSWQFISSSRPVADFYSGFSVGASYRYRVIAYNGASSSAPSRSVESGNLTVPNCNPTPPPPTMSAATTTATCSGATPRVRVSWTVVGSASAYRIIRVVGGSLAETVTLTAAQAASSGYALTQNTAAGGNFHGVYALNSAGSSLASTVTIPVNVAPCVPPPAPDTYELSIEPVNTALSSGEDQEFLARVVRYEEGKRDRASVVTNSFEIAWEVDNWGSLSSRTGQSTTFTAALCDVLGDSAKTANLRATATDETRSLSASTNIIINSCSTEDDVAGSISIIYDGRIITNPPLGFSEIIVPTIKEGR